MLIDMDYKLNHPSPLENAHKGIISYDDIPRAYTPSFNDEARFPFPPFSDILRGIYGRQKQQIRDAAIKLYKEDTYGIIRDAFDQIDIKDFVRKSTIEGESEKSIELLKESFDITEKISRKGDIMGDVVRLDFIFLSRFKTFNGKEIRMEVPVIVQYRPTISWKAGIPNMILGVNK